jgi:hypothetical protein
VDALRPAASFEGLIALGVLWLVLSALGKAKRTTSVRPSAPKPGAPPDPEKLSLQQVLREIERVKREQEGAARGGPPPRLPAPARPRTPARTTLPARARPRGVPAADRGPLGRTSSVKLPSAQEPPVVDLDQEAEQVALRRVQEAEDRNRALSDADYRSFHQRVLEEDRKAAVVKPKADPRRLRGAVVWREILGPPKAMEE